MEEIIKQSRKGESGFSLLELVIAVGIILVLTVGGYASYAGITNNARNAAVQSAATEVLRGAAAYEADNDLRSEPKDAETQWNETSQKIDGSGEAFIDVGLEVLEDCLKVTATHIRGNEAIRQNGPGCVGGDSNNGEPVDPGNEEETGDADGRWFIPASMDMTGYGNASFKVEILVNGEVVETIEDVLEDDYYYFEHFGSKRINSGEEWLPPTHTFKVYINGEEFEYVANGSSFGVYDTDFYMYELTISEFSGGNTNPGDGDENTNPPSESNLCTEIDFDWEAAYWYAWENNPPVYDPDNEGTWGNWAGPTTPDCVGTKPYVPGPWHDPEPQFPGLRDDEG